MKVNTISVKEWTWNVRLAALMSGMYHVESGSYHEQLQQQHQQKQQVLGFCVGEGCWARLGDVSLRVIGDSRSAGTGPVY